MRKIIWIFGVGASVACNLRWVVPREWKEGCDSWTDSERDCHIEKIRNTLRKEILKPEISQKPYESFLARLKGFSTIKNILMTTNWDTLLDSAVGIMYPKICPKWLKSTHVYHLNGTIEEASLETNPEFTRSTFLLETDRFDKRKAGVEFNIVVRNLLWADVVVVVGMSFECNVDNGLLKSLSVIQDLVPIGAAEWLIVNCNKSALLRIEANLKSLFPGVNKIQKIEKTFEKWIQEGLPGLKN